jgi:23S rRNA-/tRNA-specific pseudouridylate synthase
MNELHSAGSIEKIYHALVLGGPEADSGIIDAPIDRRPLPSLLRFVGPGGKPSRTEFQVLNRCDDLTKLALRPITGRTHQLRVHCSHMGFPILGDPQYGSEDSLARSKSLGLSSQLLCAKSLTFPHPVTGEAVIIRSSQDAMLPDF